MALNILITNDDGMNAAQLVPLVHYCRRFGQVDVVVPKVEQSGKSHGIEIHKSFEAKKVSLAPDVTAWAVDSTPADCVRFAVLGLHWKPDFVISGINRGLNIGTDILYSGTVGAAGEAVNFGIPALALSTTPKNYDAGQALSQLDTIFAYLKEKDLYAHHSFYNVNIPANPKGIRVTHQGGPYFSDSFPMEAPDIYRPTGIMVWQDRGDDTLDTDATLHGYISITPLTTDKTCWNIYSKLTGQE